MLNAGLLARYGASSGMAELELLTSSDRFVWTWDADDPAVAGVAAGTVRRAVSRLARGQGVEDAARPALRVVSCSPLVP